MGRFFSPDHGGGAAADATVGGEAVRRPGIEPAELGDLRSTARDLSSRAPKGSELARVAQRIETLVGNQLDRPERPAGWEPPFPRVQQ